MGRKSDYKHIVPACPACHREMHNKGEKTFAVKYGLNLDVLAAMYEEAWRKHQDREAHFLPIGTTTQEEQE